MLKKNGTVLIFSLMVLSVIIILTEQLIRSVAIGSSFTKTIISREHAKVLALGGINLAIAQLTADTYEQTSDEIEKTTDQQKKDAEEQGTDKSKDKLLKKFVLKLISNINRFQTFNLDSKIDGVSGQLKICITCEHGKININEAFDFKKQELKAQYQALLAGLVIPDKIPAGEFAKRISDFLKKRNKKLYDVTELIDINGFERLDAFYSPPKLDLKGNGQTNSDLALQDIFTIWTSDGKIDPLLFSDSICAILGLRRPKADDYQKQSESFKKIANEFKDDWGKDWDSNWKNIQIIYDNKPKLLNNIKDILVEKFDPKVYSILSYAKVENVEQRLLAVIKKVEEKESEPNQAADNSSADKNKSENQQAQQNVEKTDKKDKSFFKIVRFYWL